MADIGSIGGDVFLDNDPWFKSVKQVKRSADSLEKRIGATMQKVGASMVRVGTRASAMITAPLVAAGVGMVKLASDAEEIAGKFSVVFSSVRDDADAMADALRNDFGLATSTAQDLLSGTADLLSGFGFTQESALDLSGQVQKLAIDLASFTNIEGGAERASQALTKALLGERESVKELGIAILEEDVKAKIKAMEVTGELTGLTERQKKAQATLALAFEQSKNATGDYARTSESTANQMRLLRERAKELAQELGTILLPDVKDMIKRGLELVEAFRDLDPEMKKSIVQFAKYAAVIGPVIVALGVLTLAAKVLIPIIGVLLVNAFTTFTGGLAAATIGLIAVTKAIEFQTQSAIRATQTLDQNMRATTKRVELMVRMLRQSGQDIEFADIFNAKSQVEQIRLISKEWMDFQENVLGKSTKEALESLTILWRGTNEQFRDEMHKTQREVSPELSKIIDVYKGIFGVKLEAPAMMPTDIEATDAARKLARTIQDALNEADIKIFLEPGIGGLPDLAFPEGDVFRAFEGLPDLAGPLRAQEDQIVADAQERMSQFVSIFQGAFESVFKGQQSFGKAMVGAMLGIAQMILNQLITTAIQKIAVRQAEVAATSAAAAPHPFLIPAFVAIGLGALSAALSSVGWERNNEGGGGGGAGAAPMDIGGDLAGLGAQGQDTERFAQRLANPVPDDLGRFGNREVESVTGDRFGGFEIRVTDEQLGHMMDLIVRQTEDGTGSTTNRLLTAGDVGGLVPANG